MNNPLVIKPHSVIWTTDVDWALNNLFCSELTESDGLIQQSSVVCPDRKPRQRNRKTCYARRGDVVRDRRKQTDGVVKEGFSEAQWHYRHSRKKLDGFWRKSEVCSGGFIALRPRIRAESHLWGATGGKTVSLLRFQSVCLRSLPAATLKLSTGPCTNVP